MTVFTSIKNMLLKLKQTQAQIDLGALTIFTTLTLSFSALTLSF
jgi:hypothetical protein